MSYGNAITVTATSAVVILAVTSLVLVDLETDVFAEESNYPYDVVDNIRVVTTFTFRDGTEVIEFPVFEMTSDFVSNTGTTFRLQGVINDAPYLHKALDDAFKYRQMKTTAGSSFEYDYRFFDVKVDVLKDDNTVRKIHYRNCEILDSKVETLSDDYESYVSTGFAIVDTIDFQCGGVNPVKTSYDMVHTTNSTGTTEHDYGTTEFKFAKDARTFVVFGFDNGAEKIEFPIFELNSGFGESDSTPSFTVTGIVGSYPLLHEAIDNARKVAGRPLSSNQDFKATVEFVNGENKVRGLGFVDCRVTEYVITTMRDKEEGFTGKRGFAVVEEIGFQCSGLNPVNPNLRFMDVGTPQRPTQATNSYLENSYNMGTGPHSVVTFTFKNGIEKIDFPKFEQTGDLYAKSNPSFEVAGIPGGYPLLYKAVDDSRMVGQKSTGINQAVGLFDASVEMKYGDNVVRVFQYSKCHVTDYVVKTQHDNEESFFKGFALENVFDFECQGYKPGNPPYDAIFVKEKAKTQSTSDLRKTHNWDTGFE